MITNFENITEPLKPSEMEWVPAVMSAFIEDAYRKDHWLSSKNLIKAAENKYRRDAGKEKFLQDYTLRKIVNMLRKTGFMPICSSNAGYWLATTKEELDDQIKSLKERANGILAAAKGLEAYKFEKNENKS